MVSNNIGNGRVCCYGACCYYDDAVLSWIGSSMIGSNWFKLEDSRMEYEVIEDDSGINWDDPDVIRDVFNQTDTKLDRFLEKCAYYMYGKPMMIFGKVFVLLFGGYLLGHIVRWLL